MAFVASGFQEKCIISIPRKMKIKCIRRHFDSLHSDHAVSSAGESGRKFQNPSVTLLPSVRAILLHEATEAPPYRVPALPWHKANFKNAAPLPPRLALLLRGLPRGLKLPQRPFLNFRSGRPFPGRWLDAGGLSAGRGCLAEAETEFFSLNNFNGGPSRPIC